MDRRRRLVLIVVPLLVAAACGGGSQAGDDPSLVGTRPATTSIPGSAATAPSSTVALTAPATAASTTVASTAAPTTTAEPTTAVTVSLPTPDPPPDEQAVESAGQLGHVEIPKLGLDLSFFEGVSLPTLDKGPGHWPGSAMPGQVGNVVIAGHRVSHSRPFRYIDKLVEGDELTFVVGDVRSTYVVTGTEIVTPEAIEIVDQTPEPTATLFACHPPGSTQFRWVTHLKLKP